MSIIKFILTINEISVSNKDVFIPAMQKRFNMENLSM